jgi:peptidoglycan/LPS O-acetylase OafA/YrhL
MTFNSFIQKFQRVTSSGKFISEIDGLRFIAIGTVVLFHINANPHIGAVSTNASYLERLLLLNVVTQGFHGVQLFFIISGFILAYPFASHYLKGKSRVNLKQYFIRRVTRLEPPYMVCMLGLFLIWIFWKDWNFTESFPHLAASLGYVHNITYGEESIINNVAWSLEIEIQFYLLVPLLAKLFSVSDKTLRRSLIVGIGLLTIIGHWYIFESNPRLSMSILNHLHFFLIGFLLADIFLIDWNETPKRLFKWDIVSLIGWPLLFVMWNFPDQKPSLFTFAESSPIETILYPVCAFFLYVAVFRGKLTNKILTIPWLTAIGGMCYTIYLLHNPVMGFIIRFTHPFLTFQSYSLTFIMQSLVLIPLMLSVCGLFFLLIEKPCMYKDWPKRLSTNIWQFWLKLISK